ncbi:MAG TPA: hypothetical protein VK870_05385 [Ignavibacteriaceae bacterium]|nr:hypothetical protein [Ignavibacteriaceae bacterium]
MIDILKVAILIAAIPVIIQAVLLLNVKSKLPLVRFFIFSVLITVFLIIIIEVKLHNVIKAWINIPNTIIYFIYASLIFYYLIKYKSIILIYHSLLMLSSFAFMGIAVILNLLSNEKIIQFTQANMIEDIFHLSGTIF